MSGIFSFVTKTEYSGGLHRLYLEHPTTPVTVILSGIGCCSSFDKPVLSLTKGSPRTGCMVPARVVRQACSDPDFIGEGTHDELPVFSRGIDPLRIAGGYYPWKMSSGRNADTVTLGRSTILLTFRSTATLHIM